jgi:spermidine synthase
VKYARHNAATAPAPSERDIHFPSHFEQACKDSAGKPFAFDNDDMRTLHLDDRFIQSAMRISKPDELLLSYTRAMMGFLLFKPQPRHILMIGLGGGSLAKYCHASLPQTRISVLEIDSNVIALRDRFLIPADDARFRIIHADAVDYIAGTSDKPDVILHDGFSVDGLAPALCTPSFYRACHLALDADGVMVSNLWSDASDLRALMQRLHAIFDARLWWCGAGENINRIVFSVKGAAPLLQETLQKRAAQFDLRQDLFLCALLESMQSAEGKSAAAFEKIAGNEMQAAFMLLDDD